MDKYEYTIKTEKIKKLVERKDYETAAKIADTIDWERVKNARLLSTVSQAYEKAGRYEEAKDMLLMAYERAPVGRRFLSKLTELAVKQGSFDEAEDYLKEFTAASPQDPSRLVLRYEIAKAKGEPAERLIMILEAYQKREFEEKWSYELAELYFKSGKAEACVKLCDEIVLWFGVGPYVDKALELKQRIMPLSPEQVEKQENKEKYLRRLEDVQREFEGRTAVPAKKAREEGVRSVAELAAEAMREQAATAEPPEERPAEAEPSAEEQKIRSLQEARDRQAGQGKARRQAQEEELRRAEEARQREEARLQEEARLRKEARRREEEEARQREAALTREIEEKAAMEMASMQAEIEASLAREIETEAMSATINEAMLRKTAAAMEEVGAVQNDHSDISERTKVAAGPFGERTRTKEFVIQARAIRKALNESGAGRVSAEEVEAQIEREKAALEAAGTGRTDGKAQPEAASGAAPSRARSAAALQKKEPQAEEPEEESWEVQPEAEEAQAISGAVQPEAAEAQAISGAAEPQAINRSMQPEAEESRAISKAVEPEAEESRAEDAVQIKTERSEVQDHYVLIASDNEESGLHECAAYIRRMRELMGRPVCQVAKISGVKLAAKNIEKILAKLQGRDLIVMGIAGLPVEILSRTIDYMAQDEVECFIALIDTEEEIDKLQRRMAFFADCRVLTCEGGGRAPEPQEKPERNPMPVPEQKLEQKPAPEPEPEQKPAKKPEPMAKPAPVPEALSEPAPDGRKGFDSEFESKAPNAKRPHRTLAELVEEELRKGGQAAALPAPDAEEEADDVEADIEIRTDTEAETPAADKAPVKAEIPAAIDEAEKAAKPASEDEMSPNDFFDFAVEYARMLDAVVDDMGGLALFAEIEECQQERIALTEELAQELVEKAILRAERRSIKSFFSNRYDKEGYLILKEEHFKE